MTANESTTQSKQPRRPTTGWIITDAAGARWVTTDEGEIQDLALLPANETVEEVAFDDPANPRLLRALAEDDDAEDRGELHESERITYHTCKTWSPDDHINSVGHKRALGIHPAATYSHADGRFVFANGTTR